jgi:hypothetical protein
VSFHTGKQNSILADWLWEYHSICVLFLPTRTPEWNLIELVWNTLVKRMLAWDIEVLCKQLKYNQTWTESDVAAFVAQDILSNMDHDLIWSFFRHCFKGYLIDDD